jgi:hypothetical protein
MKNLINKFLGVDILQEENLKLRSLLMDANKTINKVKQSVSIIEDTDWNEVARDNFNYDDLANAVDMYDLAENIETSDIAYNIDMNDLACHVSTADIASELDMDEVIEGCGINIDTLAEQVAERIADREGMQHLVSEELDAQGVSSVTTDAVESMIHTAIEQFADSLEVMVSAKLNINK